MPIELYRVYRDNSLIQEVVNPTYTDTGLTNGVAYSYQVSAVNEVGEGPRSGAVAATPTASAPPPLNSITVTTIAGLKAALADNQWDEIVVQDGSYVLAPAGNQASNSLFIGAAYASRTRPVLVRAQTNGGVTFTGNGTTYFGALVFTAGAHHQTWRGFVLANGTATATGVIVFGDANQASLSIPAHHITIQNFTFANTLHGYPWTVGQSNANDHAIYFSDNLNDGSHDIVIENTTFNLNGTNPLHSAFHFFTHGYSNGRGAYNVTVRNVIINGGNQSIMIWDPTGHDLLFEDITISNARRFAVRYEAATAVVLKRVNSTGSGEQGFYSSKGSAPAGVTFGTGADSCSLA